MYTEKTQSNWHDIWSKKKIEKKKIDFLSNIVRCWQKYLARLPAVIVLSGSLPDFEDDGRRFFDLFIYFTIWTHLDFQLFCRVVETLRAD